MSVATSFTGLGISNELAIRPGATLAYSVSGTFVGTVILEQQHKFGWVPVTAVTAPGTGTVVAEEPGERLVRFRWRCSAFTSGTIVTGLTEPTDNTTDGQALASPLLTTPKGAVHAIEATFTETAGAGVYTGAVPVPAGATILDVIVNGVALWNPATSAVLKVGDAADDDGYFIGVDLMATDLLAGESLSFAQAGGKAGAYIANSQVSPRYSASARVISGIVTVVGGSGSTGRTRMTVVYHLPVTADLVVATKA